MQHASLSMERLNGSVEVCACKHQTCPIADCLEYACAHLVRYGALKNGDIAFKGVCAPLEGSDGVSLHHK